MILRINRGSVLSSARTAHLPGLAGKVEYAQLLNDGSEIRYAAPEGHAAEGLAEGTLTLTLPVLKPDVIVPVVELFLTGR